jgi:hypothetical protein
MPHCHRLQPFDRNGDLRPGSPGVEGPERELPDPGLTVCCQKCDQKHGAPGRSTLDADGVTVFVLYGLGRHARPQVFRGRTSFEVVCPYHGSRGTWTARALRKKVTLPEMVIRI